MRAKTTILFCLLFLICFLPKFVSGQNSPKLWQVAGTSTDEGRAIAKDDKGNMYHAGIFQSHTTFGCPEAPTLKLDYNSAGSRDIFISKYDSEGKLLWVTTAGGTDLDEVNAMKYDTKSGRIYIAGIYTASATFGSISLKAKGNSDAFVACLDNTGKFIWATSGGGDSLDIANDLAIDNEGNVWFTGEYKGKATFGTNTFTSELDTIKDPNKKQRSRDMFYAKLNSDGQYLFSGTAGGPYAEYGKGIVTDNTNNVYLLAQYGDSTKFESNLLRGRSNQILLCAFDEKGKSKWLRKISGTSYAYGTDLAINPQQTSLYLTGDFLSLLTFYKDEFTTVEKTIKDPKSINHNIFIAKYDLKGNLEWAEQDASLNNIYARSISVNDDGNAFITGNFECTFTEYNTETNNNTQAPNGDYFHSLGYLDIFITEYNNTGSRTGIRHIGGIEADNSEDILAGNGHYYYTTGSFQNQLHLYQRSDYINYPCSSILKPYNDRYRECDPSMTKFIEWVQDTTKSTLGMYHYSYVMLSKNARDGYLLIDYFDGGNKSKDPTNI